MAEEKEEPEPKSFWPWVWKTGAMGLVAMLTWLGGYVAKEYERYKEVQSALDRRLADLEQDKAKWATLASLEQQQMELKIQLEVMRQVWSYEYGRNVPTGFPVRQGQPELKPPAELFRDIDRYKAIQEQKMGPKK